MANEVALNWKNVLWTQVLGHVFKIILMNSTFVFNKDTDDLYADVLADEHVGGTGYTVGGQTLAGITLTESAVLDRVEITWNNVTWTASGGSIVTSGAIIYDDTLAGDPIVSYKDAGGVITAPAGTPIIISNIMETLEDV